MRRPLFFSVLTLMALVVASCSGGGEGETRTGTKPASKAEQAPEGATARGTGVAPVLARPDLLPGDWLRAAREGGREGLSIESDGTLRLVGYLQSGVDWSLDGDIIVLHTLVPTSHEPVETRLRVEQLGDHTLSLGLSNETTDLAGTYQRGEITHAEATVESSQPLGEDEFLYVRLYAPLAPGGPAAALIGFQGVAAPVEWPVSIRVAYDPGAVPIGAKLEMQAFVVSHEQTLRRSPRAQVPADSTASAELMLPPQ